MEPDSPELPPRPAPLRGRTLQPYPPPLPPEWIQFFSWLFLLALIPAAMAVWELIRSGTAENLNAFGLTLEPGRDPLGSIVALLGLLVLAGLTGLFILTRRRFAYDFAIGYCVTALVLPPAVFFALGRWGDAWNNGFIERLLLLGFLVHLVCHRRAWRIQAAQPRAAVPELPPTWVKFFSFLFLMFLVVVPMELVTTSGRETGSGIEAFGLSLQAGRDPSGWLLAMDLVLFSAGLTGLFILTRRRYAYDFAIGYCLAAFAGTLSGHFLLGHWNEQARNGALLQYLPLICFLVHLLRHRRAWREQTTKPTAALQPLQPSPQL
jgi:hydrogenase-4 membrane subunit HyfE